MTVIADSKIWVCTDCILKIANDDTSGIPETDLPAFTAAYRAGVERLLGDRYGHLVNGGSHEPYCLGAMDEDGTELCDCDNGGFQRTPCELCQRPEAGDKARRDHTHHLLEPAGVPGESVLMTRPAICGTGPEVTRAPRQRKTVTHRHPSRKGHRR